MAGALPNVGGPNAGRPPMTGALPNVIVIGAMKCGTTALHRYLDQHPEICMSRPKELNFFFGPADAASWHVGNWSRGLAWYRCQFPPDATVRGESSPGYTSPDHPGVAERMAAVVPAARLVYLVRDPLERAVSQYRHHRADGTERRAPEEALLDPASQYVSRGRYYQRLRPFLDRFPPERIAVVAHEELLAARRLTLRGLFRFVGVDDGFWSEALTQRWHPARSEPVEVAPPLRRRLRDAFRDDAQRLRELAGREFPRWSV